MTWHTENFGGFPDGFVWLKPCFIGAYEKEISQIQLLQDLEMRNTKVFKKHFICPHIIPFSEIYK